MLRLVYCVVNGECAAAQHTKSLIEALAAHGESVLADRAEAALAAAAADGALSRLRRWRYVIDCAQEAVPCGSRVTLRAVLSAGGDILRADSLVMYWNREGMYQLLP